MSLVQALGENVSNAAGEIDFINFFGLASTHILVF
jgi:Holliday junction resolvase-like predicted endonuclease